MKAKFRISVSVVPEKLRDKFPILKSLSFGLLSNALNMNGHNLMRGGKLDYSKIFNHLSKDPNWGKNFNKTKMMLNEIAPLVGITDFLPLTREEKKELKSIERAYRNPDLDYDYFKDAEINQNDIEDTDYVVRNDFGRTFPSFYRFLDDNGTPKRLHTEEERNMLRMVYAMEYGNSDSGVYDDYMGAVPIIVGNVKKWGRSFDKTRDEFGNTIK